MLELSDKVVHLWLAFPKSIKAPDLLNSYNQLLSKEERVQKQRYYFAEDRQRYLITRALIRTVLSKYATTTPENWLFTKNVFGRPEIVTNYSVEKSLSFNISHTKDLIICGVTKHQALGIDTENILCRQAPLDLVNIFSKDEECIFSCLPENLKHEYFFYYWTLKEAYVKARGMGLTLPLEQFTFTFTKEKKIEIKFDSCLVDTSNNWRFWLLRLTKAHLASICVSKLLNMEQNLIVKSIIPLRSEVSHPFEILKQSSIVKAV